MPKILHTGDLHLNALRKFRNLYLPRMADTLSRISRVAKKRKVDHIVMTGDVFHRRDIHHEERTLFAEWLRTAPAQIVGISGNHDKRSQGMGDTSLSYLKGLTVSHRNHFIYDGPPFVLAWPTCTFILVPYEKWTDSEFYVVLDALVAEAKSSRFAETNPIVVVMHEAVKGCVADGGFKVTHNNQIHFDKKLRKRFKDVTYWALGDMHTCQSVAPNAWYAGAPHQTNFGEEGEKGVLIVDTDNPTEPEFVNLNAIPLVTVEDTPENYEFRADTLYRFRPGHSLAYNVHVPDNAIVEAPTTIEPVASSKRGTRVGLFDGLEGALQRSGLKKELIPLGLTLANKAAKTLNIPTGSPKQK